MKLSRILTALSGVAVMAMCAMGTASAHGDEKHTNLKIIKDSGKQIDVGMKAFSKGLGVKCNACHAKGDFAADSVGEKEAGRKFFTAVVGEKDAAKRAEALKPLLDALKLKEPKDAAELWKGVESFQKQ
jgi:hypothetical protein